MTIQVEIIGYLKIITYVDNYRYNTECSLNVHCSERKSMKIIIKTCFSNIQLFLFLFTCLLICKKECLNTDSEGILPTSPPSRHLKCTVGISGEQKDPKIKGEWKWRERFDGPTMWEDKWSVHQTLLILDGISAFPTSRESTAIPDPTRVTPQSADKTTYWFLEHLLHCINNL